MAQIEVDGQPVEVDSLTDDQKYMLDHVYDIDQKIGRTQFELDQLRVARQTFATMLRDSVRKVESEK